MNTQDERSNNHIPNQNNQIDKYIKDFPQETQEVLQKIRKVVNKAAPGCEEAMSYGIPTLKFNGKYVVYFAGFKNHVSVYPIFVTAGDKTLQKELTPYLSGKGTAKFPLNKPIPYDLIEKIAKLKLQERLNRQK
jgi:uncharacterized protein YdhG (YjbR/CyaY superfamily)